MWGTFLVHANKDDSEQEFFFNFCAKKKSGLCYTTDVIRDFPGGASGKESACQRGRRRRCWFDPWVGKIPWRRKWQPAPVLMPGKSYGQSPCYSPWGHKESDRCAERSTARRFSVGLRPRSRVWLYTSWWMLVLCSMFTDSYCFGLPSFFSGSQNLARSWSEETLSSGKTLGYVTVFLS